MWQFEDNDELQAYHTMRDISNPSTIVLNDTASPLVIGMDANISVLPRFRADPTGMGMHDNFEEFFFSTGVGLLNAGKVIKCVTS